MSSVAPVAKGPVGHKAVSQAPEAPSGQESGPGSAAALEAIRALVTPDLVAVDQAIRTGLKSVVPLVDEVAEHIIAGGGKRLRPLLVVLAGRACGGAPGDAAGTAPHIQAAAFIEFIHTATLLHDDVVDMSSLRRGRDTANEVFGNQASVLVGDFVYSRAFQMMAAARSQRVIEIMADATNIIAEGEVLQLMNARDPDTSEERYLEVIRRKTAQLFQAGAEVAAVVSGAPAAQQQAMVRYGKHLGIAYQLVDDVLDYQSDPETRGKNLGDDLAEGKPTLPLIHAMKTGSPEQAGCVRRAIEEGGREEFPGVLAAIRATGALEIARRHAEEEVRLAAAAIAPLPVSVFRDSLVELASFAVARDF